MFRGKAGGRDRGEHPGPDPGQHPHGGQQQGGEPGPLHRQQVGAGHGLLHPLRRHVRRPRGASRTCPRPWSTSCRATSTRDGEIIPDASITKPPSAELRENQKDQDTLPPYEVLDRILELYIEDRQSADEIAAHGFPEDLVRKVLRTVNLNEYKRRQAAPGIKVTAKAFGVGRRIPIAQRFRP